MKEPTQLVTVYVSETAWNYLKKKAGLPTVHHNQTAKGIASWIGELLEQEFTDTRPDHMKNYELKTIQTQDLWAQSLDNRKPRLLTMATSDLIMAILISKNKNIIPKHKNKIGPLLGLILEAIGREELVPDDWPPPVSLSSSKQRSLKRLTDYEKNIGYELDRYLNKPITR